MKKIIIVAILLSFYAQPVFADTTSTILPSGAFPNSADSTGKITDHDCITALDNANSDESKRKTYMENKCPGTPNNPCWEELLSCGIKTGDIHLWMLPYYITRIIEFLINIAGLISVLFVIIGGYLYAWGGLTEDKEKGKKTVMYALIGLALATLSWILVNIIQTTLSA